MDITEVTGDAILTTIMGLVNDAGPNPAQLEFYSDDGGDFGDLLVAYEGAAAPFTGPGAGDAGFRRITFAAGDFTMQGLPAAGSGTPAAHFKLRSENGVMVGGKLNSVRGSADPDNGEEAVLSNVNIASGQDTTLQSFVVDIQTLLAAEP